MGKDNRFEETARVRPGNETGGTGLYDDAYKNLRSHAQPGSTDGHVLELKLNHRTGDHKGADALVYVPPRFDDSKPVTLVIYNEGLSTDVCQAFRNSHLKAQLDAAEPNTVLIMPEWQANPDTRDGSSGRFTGNGFVSGMLQEILDRTP